MFDDINNLIIVEKNRLRKKSKDFIKNFKKIENFIEREVEEIKNLENLKKSVIPEINFKDLHNKNHEIIKKIAKRGCVIIREVFDQ